MSLKNLKPEPDTNVVTEVTEVPPVQTSHPRFDGGLPAWSTLVGGWLTILCTFGYCNAFGVFQDYYTWTTDHSPSKVSWVGSMQIYLIIAIGFPAGRLFDHGHFKLIMRVGSALYVFSLFMVSLTHPDNYYQIFFAQGIGMGFGGGLIYAPALAIQAHHWRRRRALAMGIVATGTSVGGIVFAILLNNTFNGSIGFRWGVRISAFIVLALLLAANLLMTPQYPKDVQGEKPASLPIFRDVPFMIASLGYLFIAWGIFYPYFYLQLYAITHGVSQTLSFYLIAIMNGVSIAGRTIPNVFADHWGPLNVFIPICLASGVLLIGFVAIKDTDTIVVFAVLYGFFSGGFLSLLPPTVAMFAKGPSEIGIRIGIAFVIASLGPLTGSPISGALLGRSFQWERPIIFNTIVVFIGSFLVLIARMLLAKRLGVQKV